MLSNQFSLVVASIMNPTDDVDAYQAALLQTMKGETRVKVVPIILDLTLDTMGIMAKLHEAFAPPPSW